MLPSDRASLSKCYMEEDICFCAFKSGGVFSAFHQGLGTHVKTGADVANSYRCIVVAQ